MGKKIFVGNLSYSITSSTLEEIFAPYGTVESAKVITDRETSRSKGFGFVEMSTDEEAAHAIEKLNGFTVENRALSVSEAQAQAPRDSRGGGDRGGRSGGFGGGRGGSGGGGGGGRGGFGRSRF